MSHALMCGCGRRATLATGRQIYPHRADLAALKFWQCKPCRAYVGCHAAGDWVVGANGERIVSDGTLPKGTPATAELRTARRNAHAAFDPLWDQAADKAKARLDAYAWLAQQLGIEVHECHIGMFDLAQCANVIQACQGRNSATTPTTKGSRTMNTATQSTGTDEALFYDFETNGLPLFSEPSEDPRQPHIVQLGAALVNLSTRKVLSSIDLIVRPDGWTIPDDVAAIHGITTEKAMDLGVSESMALGMLLEFWREHQPRLRIAHNETFDARIGRIAIKRHEDDELADKWKAAPAFCTALTSQELVKAPPTAKMLAANRRHSKKPTLAEAYKHFTGRDMVGAHSAMPDVLACIEVYFGIADARV